ncbi:MAG: hypothetical protein ACWA44_15490 [Thiotrichales bacterium]
MKNRRIGIRPAFKQLIAIFVTLTAFHIPLSLAVGSAPECTGAYVWRVVDPNGQPVSSMADIVLSETGESTVLVDLEGRKIQSTTDFFVDANVTASGDGKTPATAFKDLREAFDSISASSTKRATINVAQGTYRWGDLYNPRFSFNIIGQGPGVTIIEHTSAFGDKYAAQVRAASLYIEGVTFSGGKNTLDLRNMSMATIVNSEIKNAATGNGFSAVNINSLLANQVTVHHNFRDGLNYHNPTKPMEVLEYQIEAYHNGQNGQWNSQGSTIHDTVKIVRVDSDFYQNPTNISDVNNSVSFNINLNSRNALSQQQGAEFLNFNVGSSAQAWIIGGEFSLGPIPSVVHAHDQSKLYYVSNFNTLSTATTTGNTPIIDNSILQALVCDPSPAGPSVCPDVMPLGNLGSGLATQDNAQGTGYLLWSSQNVHDRLYPPPDLASAADHLIAVQWDGSAWQFNNNQSYSSFDIAADDCLLAEIDFTADTVNLLAGEYGTLYDIGFGFSTGDLQVIPNQYNGKYNKGEFDILGTEVYGINGQNP